MSSDQNDGVLREQALARIKKKRDFSAHLLAYVVVNAFLVVIWAVSGAGFFWPIFPILGWGIGILFHGWDVYQKEPTETEIQKEMDRLRKP
jgi:hypothetical protein